MDCVSRARQRTDENWTEWRLGLLKFNYEFAQNLAQDSPKQAKSEIVQEVAFLSSCASVYHEICLSRRETVRLNWKLWVSGQNRETWEVGMDCLCIMVRHSATLRQHCMHYNCFRWLDWIVHHKNCSTQYCSLSQVGHTRAIFHRLLCHVSGPTPPRGLP